MARSPGLVAGQTATPTGPLTDAPGPAGEFLRSTPGRLLVAVVLLVAGWYLSLLVVRYLSQPMARRFQRPSVARTVLRGIRGLLVVGAVLSALTVLGFRLPDLVLSVTVFSAVLGLVLAPIVGSVVNGLFLLADQPYEVGDLIEIPDLNQGTQGFVDDITLRYTKVFTLDNTFLVVPNGSMRDRDVVNYSAEDERIRLSIQLLVTYESDVAAARRLVERAARDVEQVVSGGPDIRIGSARYPAGPTCYVEDYADHGVLLTLRFWAKQPYKQLTVRSAVNERIWTALEDSDVVIAYPHRHLVFDETSGQMQVRMDREEAGPPDDARSAGGSGPRAGDRPTGEEPAPDDDGG